MFQLGSHRLARRIVGTPGAVVAAGTLTATLHVFDVAIS